SAPLRVRNRRPERRRAGLRRPTLAHQICTWSNWADTTDVLPVHWSLRHSCPPGGSGEDRRPSRIHTRVSWRTWHHWTSSVGPLRAAPTHVAVQSPTALQLRLPAMVRDDRCG